MSKDQFQSHDYYLMDELLSEEHKLIRDSARAWVKRKCLQLLKNIMKKELSQIIF